MCTCSSIPPRLDTKLAKGIGRSFTNTDKVLVTLREKGATLIGDSSSQLVRAVPVEELREHVRTTFEGREKRLVAGARHLPRAPSDTRTYQLASRWRFPMHWRHRHHLVNPPKRLKAKRVPKLALARSITLLTTALPVSFSSLPGQGLASEAPSPIGEGSSQVQRTVAFTLDDLPIARGRDLAMMREVTARLLGQLADQGIPAIGFVNERKLAVPGEEAARAALLEEWLIAGLDLGNHTYSHPSLYRTALEEYEADVIRGEEVTSMLLAKRGQRLQYFRHPMLNTGPDLETKSAFERFLAERGYRVAPVTIDNDDYVYALAYDNATTTADSTLMARIGHDYIRYMDEIFGFYEGFSRRLLGREPAQILLLHANRLNADYLDEIAHLLRSRGYRFVSLDEALDDPAYSLSDQYVGERGLSWLQRWAITMGRQSQEQPGVPQWVHEIAWPD